MLNILMPFSCGWVPFVSWPPIILESVSHWFRFESFTTDLAVVTCALYLRWFISGTSHDSQVYCEWFHRENHDICTYYLENDQLPLHYPRTQSHMFAQHSCQLWLLTDAMFLQAGWLVFSGVQSCGCPWSTLMTHLDWMPCNTPPIFVCQC